MNVKEVEINTSPDLLAVLVMLPRTWFAFMAERTHCRLVVSLLSPRTFSIFPVRLPPN